MLVRSALALLCCSALAMDLRAAPSTPATPKNRPHARVELLADTTAVVPGKPFTVALKFTIDDGWHLYHLDPGDSGEPPKVKWTLPDGYSAGELHFPPAERYQSTAGVDNVYFREVALLATVTPPATAPAAADASTPVELTGNVRWLVCDARVCIPEKQAVTLSLPVAADAKPAHEEEFRRWKAAAVAGTSPSTQPAPQ